MKCPHKNSKHYAKVFFPSILLNNTMFFRVCVTIVIINMGEIVKPQNVIIMIDSYMQKANARTAT